MKWARLYVVLVTACCASPATDALPVPPQPPQPPEATRVLPRRLVVAQSSAAGAAAGVPGPAAVPPDAAAGTLAGDYAATLDRAVPLVAAPATTADTVREIRRRLGVIREDLTDSGRPIPAGRLNHARAELRELNSYLDRQAGP